MSTFTLKLNAAKTTGAWQHGERFRKGTTHLTT